MRNQTLNHNYLDPQRGTDHPPSTDTDARTSEEGRRNPRADTSRDDTLDLDIDLNSEPSEADDVNTGSTWDEADITDPYGAEDAGTDADEDADAFDDFDEEFEHYDHDLERGDRQAHRTAMHRPRLVPHDDPNEDVRRVAADDDTLATGFDGLTYKPIKHERQWLSDALGGFFIQGDITDVLRLIKGGKEASVYQVTVPEATGAPYAAAKVYRPRTFRNLRNDARYRHGRTILDEQGKQLHDERAWHAIITGTEMGKDLKHASWMSYEYVTMERLHAAGADVPRPIARGPNVILMEYVGSADRPATTLNHVALAPEEVEPLFDRVLENVALMLSYGVVHGDLSAYNILYHEGEITLIDFPQVVQPEDNPEARAIFDRDVERVCQYFASQGVERDATALAEDLWMRYVDAELDLERRPEFMAAKLIADLAAQEERIARREGYDDD